MFAYAPYGALQFKGSTNQIAQAISRDTNTNWSPQSIQSWDLAEQISRGIHPMRVIDVSPGQHFEKGALVDDGLQPDGFWQETQLYTEVPLANVKRDAASLVEKWKVAAQDADFMHTDGRLYENTERARGILNGAVELAILKQMTAPPGPRVTLVAITAQARDGVVTVMDENELAALGLSSLSHVQAINDEAIQAQADINLAEDADAVQVILDTTIPEPVQNAPLPE
jgi:hypothetical protein